MSGLLMTASLVDGTYIRVYKMREERYFIFMWDSSHILHEMEYTTWDSVVEFISPVLSQGTFVQEDKSVRIA